MAAVDRVRDFLAKSGTVDESTICRSCDISHGTFYAAIRALGDEVFICTINRRKFYTYRPPDQLAESVDQSRKLIRSGGGDRGFGLGKKVEPITPDFDNTTCEGYYPDIDSFIRTVETRIDGAMVLEVQTSFSRIIVEVGDELRRYDYKSILGGFEVRQWEIGGIVWGR